MLPVNQGQSHGPKGIQHQQCQLRSLDCPALFRITSWVREHPGLGSTWWRKYPLGGVSHGRSVAGEVVLPGRPFPLIPPMLFSRAMVRLSRACQSQATVPTFCQTALRSSLSLCGQALWFYLGASSGLPAAGHCMRQDTRLMPLIHHLLLSGFVCHCVP